MSGPGPQWHVAECLLPGLSRATAEALGRRVRQEIAGPPGSPVCYLGALLMPEDEVLLCLFAGPEAEVRAVSERAGLPFERILTCAAVGWRTAPEMATTGSPPTRGPRRTPRAAHPAPAARTRTHGDTETEGMTMQLHGNAGRRPRRLVIGMTATAALAMALAACSSSGGSTAQVTAT